MFNTIKRFVIWLNTDDEEENKKETSNNSQLINNLIDDEIKKKLTTLSRSGLALPYEVWDDFVKEVVLSFNDKYGMNETMAMLHTAIYSVRIRRNYILPPNCAPEDVVHREIVWVYGVFVTVVLYYSRLSLLQLPKLFSNDPQLAITSDKDLCKSIENTLDDINSDNVIAEILRQSLAAYAELKRGGSAEEINAAAESAKNTKFVVNDGTQEQQEEVEELKPEEPDFANVNQFLEWSLLPVSDHIQILEDGTTFYALPAFKEFADAIGIEREALVAEFESMTGLTQVRETLANGRHKGYKVK